MKTKKETNIHKIPATTTRVRAALKKLYGLDKDGEPNVSFYRSPSGYYYFTGLKGINVPSLYWYDLDGNSVGEIVDHVIDSFK